MNRSCAWCAFQSPEQVVSAAALPTAGRFGTRRTSVRAGKPARCGVPAGYPTADECTTEPCDPTPNFEPGYKFQGGAPPGRRINLAVHSRVFIRDRTRPNRGHSQSPSTPASPTSLSSASVPRVNAIRFSRYLHLPDPIKPAHFHLRTAGTLCRNFGAGA